MTPSRIVISPLAPFVAIFYHTEAEQMAALIIHALVKNGNAWKPITLREIYASFCKSVEEKVEPWFSFSRNPFFKPDPDLLCGIHQDARGQGFKFATISPVPFAGDGLDRVIEFTDHGYFALTSSVR